MFEDNPGTETHQALLRIFEQSIVDGKTETIWRLNRLRTRAEKLGAAEEDVDAALQRGYDRRKGRAEHLR